MRRGKTNTATSARQMVPLSQAAVELAMPRERLRRRIESGAVDGALVDGKWFVSTDALRGAETRTAKGAA